MYSTCVSSKLCEFIRIKNRTNNDHSILKKFNFCRIQNGNNCTWRIRKVCLAMHKKTPLQAGGARFTYSGSWRKIFSYVRTLNIYKSNNIQWIMAWQQNIVSHCLWEQKLISCYRRRRGTKIQTVQKFYKNSLDPSHKDYSHLFWGVNNLRDHYQDIFNNVNLINSDKSIYFEGISLFLLFLDTFDIQKCLTKQKKRQNPLKRIIIFKVFVCFSCF